MIISSGEDFIVRGQKRVGGTDQADAEAHLANLTIQITEQAEEIVVTSIHPRTDGRPYVVDYTLEVPARLVPEISTVNGDVTIEGVEAGLAVQIINGAVTLRDIVGSSEVDVINGSIVAQVRIRDDELIRLDGLNGDVSLSIPADTNAQLEATAGNGTVTVTNLTLTNELITSNVVTGTIGTGAGSIMLNADNGNITLTGF